MNAYSLTERVQLLPAVDWNRRLFDALIPLPQGTSYNAYLVRGSQKTALLDTSDPRTLDEFMELLETVPSVDYVIAHHAEQDHSGGLPRVLAKYPQSQGCDFGQMQRNALEPVGSARRTDHDRGGWRNAFIGRSHP